jgi:hypothetical protein
VQGVSSAHAPSVETLGIETIIGCLLIDTCRVRGVLASSACRLISNVRSGSGITVLAPAVWHRAC